MATIPIEVIVQDAENPVGPTPVDPSNPGDNTNITVPDTGAGVVDSNNSGINNSSAAISIVSIVIAVLAIGAVITLLVRRYNKRKKANIEAGNNTRQGRKAVVVTSTIAVLALTLLLGQLLVSGIVNPITTNAATSVEPGTAELDTVDKVTITATREIDSDTAVATVKNTSYATANLDFGYKVTASMETDATTANLYLDGDETSEYYIAPVSSEEDEALETNTWGYTTEEESKDYLPIPLATNPTTIVKGNNNIDNEPVDIYYTIQVDKDLPAGTYTGTLEYTLTDNNFPSTLTTMQGMTTEICEDTFTPGNQVTDPVPTATLRDTRDNKTYTIAKLADGKCWMTQNLDLDLSTEATLTPADTNITEDWTPMRSTINFTGTSVSGWSNSETTPYSADPGDVYYYTSNSDADDIRYNSLTECEVAGHTDCSHYHAGNYYNWSAAVASNDTSGMAERFSNVNTSICPAGWRLPKGPNTNDKYYNEEVNVIKAYSNILEENITEGCGGVCSYYNYLAGGFNIIRKSPLWLTRSGQIWATSLNSNGNIGSYWPSTPDSLQTIFQFAFDATSLYPTSTAARFYGSRASGFPVRCLAE